MKTHIRLLIAFLLCIVTCITVHAQTKFKYRVKIPHHAKVQKVVKVDDCTKKIDSGYTLKSEYTLKHKDVTYTITSEGVQSKDTSIIIDKTKSLEIYPNSYGIANIRIDEEDKSIIHINYWLNPKWTVPNGKTIVRETRKLKCNGTYDIARNKRALSNAETFQLYKVKPKQTALINSKWFKTADEVIEVLDKKGNIEYYLVDRWDRTADYQIKMENRDAISYHSRGVEYGPIIIPVKYRFQRTQNNIVAKEEFSSDLNVGIYGGYNLGKYKLRYETGSTLEPPAFSISLGGFLNTGVTKIDSMTTTLAATPLAKDEETSIGLFSPGIGVMASLGHLQIGFWGGIDFGMGQSAKKWNFNNQPWLGFGIAYSTGSFWKK